MQFIPFKSYHILYHPIVFYQKNYFIKLLPLYNHFITKHIILQSNYKNKKKTNKNKENRKKGKKKKRKKEKKKKRKKEKRKIGKKEKCNILKEVPFFETETAR